MTSTTETARAAKAEALLLYFAAEAHRRKWSYDRGLDDDGVPLKSEAFDALHRLGEEMRVELEKLRRLAEAPQPETQAGPRSCTCPHGCDTSICPCLACEAAEEPESSCTCASAGDGFVPLGHYRDCPAAAAEPHPTEADLRHALAVLDRFHEQPTAAPAVVAQPGKENGRG